LSVTPAASKRRIDPLPLNSTHSPEALARRHAQALAGEAGTMSFSKAWTIDADRSAAGVSP
jgi:hypothetical protein